jgi:hypothetical protein
MTRLRHRNISRIVSVACEQEETRGGSSHPVNDLYTCETEVLQILLGPLWVIVLAFNKLSG